MIHSPPTIPSQNRTNNQNRGLFQDDPEQRFQSVDIRKALMLALPLAEASIVDEIPKGFRLPEGELQSRQEPILSRKVIREALANAVMHRSYQDHGAIQIIRYSNRIEILNPGYSLKDMASLGTPGSRLRNLAIAAVLHELNWAETKGSGIRTMRRMAGDAGLPLPEFVSDRQKNEFKVALFLHHLLTEDDYAWLKALAGDTLSGDEAKALIYARETGAIDNTACCAACVTGGCWKSRAPAAAPITHLRRPESVLTTIPRRASCRLKVVSRAPKVVSALCPTCHPN